MIYLTAAFIDGKKGQDRATFVTGSTSGLLLCDGIGSLENSGQYAEEAVSQFKADPTISVQNLAAKIQERLSSPGGTTILKASVEAPKNAAETLIIECLGNGSVVHLTGHFNAERPDDLPPYRYSELFLSHTNEGTTLVRHISQNSGVKEHEAFRMEMRLNHPYGDIVLFFTDGLSSSEERFVLKAPDDRIWRNESSELHLLLQALDIWLKDLRKAPPGPEDMQKRLEEFAERFVKRMKVEGHLDDDLALGVLITQEAINTQVRIAQKEEG